MQDSESEEPEQQMPQEQCLIEGVQMGEEAEGGEGGGRPEGLSKKQQKKLIRKQKWEQQKLIRRQQKRQKEKLKKKEKRLRDKEAMPSTIGQPQTEDLFLEEAVAQGYGAMQRRREDYEARMKEGVAVVVDLQFWRLMTEKEQGSLVKQLSHCHSCNRKSPKCFNYMLTSADGSCEDS